METIAEPQSINVNGGASKEQFPETQKSTTAAVDPHETSSPPTAAAASIALQEHPQHVDTSTTNTIPQASQTEVIAGKDQPTQNHEGTGKLAVVADGLDAEAQIEDDGRVHIKICQTSQKISHLVGSLQRSLSIHHDGPKVTTYKSDRPPPKMNVVIQVVGSRGDVQPFVALGKVLKEQYHHRVRLATHGNFKDFVESNGLEFFNIGGDPAALMAFMVKNPGLIPGFDSLRHGDVGKRQHEIFNILLGCWRSCIEAGDGMDTELPEDDLSDQARPFVADVIIANPPSFAHIHCAEKLGIPVHLMFTMPWSPTQVFPHPLANIQSTDTDPSVSNLISYSLVEGLTWQGLGRVINNFRRENLRLDPVSLLYAPNLLNRLQIPYTYCWSPALIPKPNDWGQHISIAGFYFLSLASSFTPDPDLIKFLDSGPPPVYIGFGSIVVADPDAMTTMIFQAVKKAGVRALVSKGWGGLGKGDLDVPDEIYMLGNIPHDWLFQRVSCVVHHGGAGTTAAGIALGRPTVVVPFFGDQPFWGSMIARAGAGPFPVAYKKLTADILASSITEALKPSQKDQAAKLAASIAREKGTVDGALSFHSQLDTDHMRCSLAPSRTAVWRIKRTQIRLSALAATILRNEGLIDFDDLKLYRPKEYNTQSEPRGPGTGLALGFVGAIGDIVGGVTDLSRESAIAVNQGGNAIQQSIKSAKFSAPSLHSSKTLTPTGTVSSTASTLIPEKSDLHETLTTSLPSSSVASGQETPVQGPDAPDLSALSTVKSEPAIDHALDVASPVGTTTTAGSSTLGRSISDATTVTGHHHHHHAPIGSQKLEIGPAKVVGRFVEGLVRAPLDLTVTLTQGFHNLPKVYGDHTVRPPDRVTDFQSGVKQAGKELGYGFYDGFTGVVTHPLEGAKGEGLLGFAKGVGKGFVGLVTKPVAAVLGVPAYTYKGIYKELHKSGGKPLNEFIMAARTADGLEDWTTSTVEEREQILARWKEIKPNLKKVTSHGDQSITGRQLVSEPEG